MRWVTVTSFKYGHLTTVKKSGALLLPFIYCSLFSTALHLTSDGCYRIYLISQQSFPPPTCNMGGMTPHLTIEHKAVAGRGERGLVQWLWPQPRAGAGARAGDITVAYPPSPCLCIPCHSSPAAPSSFPPTSLLSLSSSVALFAFALCWQALSLLQPVVAARSWHCCSNLAV